MIAVLCETAIAVPCVVLPGAIRPVSAELASVEPFVFFAVTLTRTVWATSADPDVCLGREVAG